MYNIDATKDVPEDRLPIPKGYKLLIALPSMEEKTAGGIILTDKHVDEEQVASMLGCVLKVGPEAYDKMDEPWCEVGDWVIFRKYSGTRFKIDDVEFRLLNDDTIEAVVTDPRGLTRV